MTANEQFIAKADARLDALERRIRALEVAIRLDALDEQINRLEAFDASGER